MQRLRLLQRAMRSYVNGQPQTLPAGGSDEIGDMTESLRFFVDRIEQREAALRASESNSRASWPPYRSRSSYCA